ncbi:TPA: sulfite exporter TauE/SafE family protein [Legionella pneumophila]
MFALAGYSLAMMMGMTLGLIGAGGSILAVPILVYFFGVKPVIATGYSLLIVGCTALVGVSSYWKNDTVHFKKAVAFAIPAMISVLFTRLIIIPGIPETIMGLGKDRFIMIIFSILMLVAAISMLKPVDKMSELSSEASVQPHRIIIGSSIVGFLTGMVGAGGGFLIIPSLIAIFKFNIKEAIGTSLTVITINSLVGFNGDLAKGIPMDWLLLGAFLSMTIIGVLIGAALGKRINGNHLKKSFAIFLVILSVAIIFNELILGG